MDPGHNDAIIIRLASRYNYQDIFDYFIDNPNLRIKGNKSKVLLNSISKTKNWAMKSKLENLNEGIK
jgi:hypothetical protein